MKIEQCEINGRSVVKITSDEGMTLVRLHDGEFMGDTIILGVDYSTGEPREDLLEYYNEVEAIYANDIS